MRNIYNVGSTVPGTYQEMRERKERMKDAQVSDLGD